MAQNWALHTMPSKAGESEWAGKLSQEEKGCFLRKKVAFGDEKEDAYTRWDGSEN